VATADGGVKALHYLGLPTDPRAAVVESVRVVSSTTVVQEKCLVRPVS
jgi:hypothetical protein